MVAYEPILGDAQFQRRGAGIVRSLPFGGPARVSEENFRFKTSSQESLFLQHILASLRPAGRAVVLVPQSLLFRRGADEQIRRQMLGEFHVDASISLPSGWLKGSRAKAGILCISRQEPARLASIETILRSRLVALSDDNVTFRWRGSAHGNKKRL